MFKIRSTGLKAQGGRRRRATRVGLVITVLLTGTALWGTRVDPNFFRDFQLKHGRSEMAGVKVLSFSKSVVSNKVIAHGRKRPEITYRVKYQFQDQSGWPWNSEETVDDSMYAALVSKNTARVQYLKQDPKVCRLVK